MIGGTIAQKRDYTVEIAKYLKNGDDAPFITKRRQKYYSFSSKT